MEENTPFRMATTTKYLGIYMRNVKNLREENDKTTRKNKNVLEQIGIPWIECFLGQNVSSSSRYQFSLIYKCDTISIKKQSQDFFFFLKKRRGDFISQGYSLKADAFPGIRKVETKVSAQVSLSTQNCDLKEKACLCPSNI